MNVPSLSFEPPWALRSRDGRHDGCAHRCGLSSLWMALELASTLRTLTDCFGAVGCWTLFKALGRAARRFTSSGNVVGSARQAVVQPQLRDLWLRTVLVSSWRVRGTRVLNRCASAGASRSDRCLNPWQDGRH